MNPDNLERTNRARPEDWQLEAPSSLKEIVRDELIATRHDDFERGKDIKPITDQTIDDLMTRVYAHIEQQALEVYHSNEPWALRQWALNNILKEELVNETTNEIAHALISPVIEWQSESYNPLARYKEKLIADGKPEHSIGVLLVAVAKFVARKGRKKFYPDEDIIEHISYLRKEGHILKHRDYVCAECGTRLRDGKCTKCGSTAKVKRMVQDKVPYKPASIYNEVIRLKGFFQFLHGKNWQMPVAMPAVPDKEDMFQPMLSDEEIEALIFSTVIDHIPADWIVRLAASTLYGCRVSELGDIESKYINLDREASSLYIRTRKKGVRKAQPIPMSVRPIFAIPVLPMKGWRLQYILKSMCSKAEVNLPERAGWHALRRTVVTDIYTKTNVKEMPIIQYFRWSTKQRHLGQLPTYVKLPTEASDREVLSQHPMLKMWETIVPYLVKWHPEYSTNPRAIQLYNENIS
jgi:hypothetical protein